MKVATVAALLYFLALPSSATGRPMSERAAAILAEWPDWPRWANPDEYAPYDSTKIQSDGWKGVQEYPNYFDPWGRPHLVRRRDGTWVALSNNRRADAPPPAR